MQEVCPRGKQAQVCLLSAAAAPTPRALPLPHTKVFLSEQTGGLSDKEVILWRLWGILQRITCWGDSPVAPPPLCSGDPSDPERL